MDTRKYNYCPNCGTQDITNDGVCFHCGDMAYLNPWIWREEITEPGWYWRKYTKPPSEKPEIVQVRFYGEQLCIQNWGIPTENVLWAGPIPAPKE